MVSGADVERCVTRSQPVAPGSYLMVSLRLSSVPPLPLVTITVCGAGIGPLAMAENETVSALVTIRGGGVTVTCAVAPGAFPVTSPEDDTEAIEESAVVQSVATPMNWMPEGSVATDISRTRWPTEIVVAAGVTTSETIRCGPTAVSVVQARTIAVATTMHSRLDVIPGLLGLLNGRDHPRPARAREARAEGRGVSFLATCIGILV